MINYTRNAIRYFNSIKGFHLLLGVLSILFLVFYFLLAFHLRPATDDFQKMFDLHHRGVLGFMQAYFQNWSFKWSTMLFEALILSFMNLASASYFPAYLYYLISMLIFICAVYIVLGFLQENIFPQFISSRMLRFYVSILCIAAIFFFNPVPAETWFWLSGSFGYMQVVIFFFVQMACIMRKKTSVANYLLLIASSLILGGNVEISVIDISIVYLSCILFLKFSKHAFTKTDHGRNIFKKLIVSEFFLVLSAIPSYLAPGTMKRLAYEKLKMSGQATGAFNFMDGNLMDHLFQFRSLLCFLFLLTLFFFVAFYRDKLSSNLNKKGLKEFVVYSGIVSLCVLLVNFIFFHQIYANLGMLRAWSFFSLMLIIHFTGLTMLLALNIKFKVNSLLFSNSSLILLILILCFYIFRQNRILNTYTAAYDSRILYLLELNKKGQKDVVIIAPLPDSGMLIKGDISPDPDRYLNVYYTHALHLSYKVRVDSPVQ
jgi:hypothetical protein